MTTYYELPVVGEVFELPCCGLKLRNVVFPIHCPCDDGNLNKRIELCRFRGKETGEVVKCGCPGNDSQPIYQCKKKGLCIKHAADNKPKEVTICLGCDVVRDD